MSKVDQDKSIAESGAELSVEDYAYDLPPELIAKEPSPERTGSRLMVLSRQNQSIEDKHFADLTSYLRKGDVLVLNDTRVIPARIIARRSTGGIVEIQLLKPEATQPGVWQAMASPLKKLKEGEELIVEIPAESGAGTAAQEARLKIAGFFQSSDSQRRVLIDFGGQAEVHSLLSNIGRVPLPPYILKQRSETHHQTQMSDLERYQTVYAKHAGAVAAPTAGLHFSPDLLSKLESRGVILAYLTLHVGPGTFKPISDSLEEHTIESEQFFISSKTAAIINDARAKGGRVIAVGTTSCRALETAGASGTLEHADGAESTLYIRPGHKFAMVNALITNFHLSKSSLLVLVSAFAGHDFIMKSYRHAIGNRYRFYSYGDAMFIY